MSTYPKFGVDTFNRFWATLKFLHDDDNNDDLAITNDVVKDSMSIMKLNFTYFSQTNTPCCGNISGDHNNIWCFVHLLLSSYILLDPSK